MIHHVVGLFTHPDQEWREIRGDKEESVSHMYLTHTLILAAIPAVSAFIGTTQVGWVIGSRSPVMLTQESALWMTVMSYLAMLGGVAIMGAFIHWMARTYDASPSMARCVAFATYTATPLFIGGLAALYPHMWLGMVVGTAAICYTVYLLYVGLPTFMSIDPDEGFLFSSSVLAVGLVVLVAIMAFTVIVWGLGVGPIDTNYAVSPSRQGHRKVALCVMHDHSAPDRFGNTRLCGILDISGEMYSMPEQLNTRVEDCFLLAESFFKRSFKRPQVSLKLRGQKAGVAHLHENLLRFNPQLYRENSQHFLKQTVAHEVAHLIAHQLFGERIQPHGEEWQLIMRGVYELPPDRCHTYEIKRRQVTRYIYRCPCADSDFPFSSQRHGLVRQGRRYLCRRCRQTLVFTGETRVE